MHARECTPLLLVFTAEMEPGGCSWRGRFAPAQTPDNERAHVEPSVKPRRWWREQQGTQKLRPISMVQRIKLPFTEKRHSGLLLVTPVLQQVLAGWEMASLCPNRLSTDLISNFTFQSVLKRVRLVQRKHANLLLERTCYRINEVLSDNSLISSQLSNICGATNSELFKFFRHVISPRMTF